MQVIYAVKEYACTAVDVVARRLRLAFLNTHAAQEALPRIVELMAKELNWDSEEQKAIFLQCFSRVCRTQLKKWVCFRGNCKWPKNLLMLKWVITLRGRL